MLLTVYLLFAISLEFLSVVEKGAFLTSCSVACDGLEMLPSREQFCPDATYGSTNPVIVEHLRS